MEEELVKRENVSFEAIPAAGVHGVGARALPGNLMRLTRGFLAARRVLASYRPDVLLFTGGYVAVPMALAARTPLKNLDRPANLLYVPDIEPGLALKTLARFADCIALTVEESRAYFPNHPNLVITGYPIRPALKTWDIARARRTLQLRAGLPSLLVFGGSLGARSINRALLSSLPELLPEMQIVHVTGKLDWEEVSSVHTEIQKTNPDLAERYHIFPYLHEEMGAALTAADLVVSRAGASVLGEFPNFGLPAILVPYPYAWRYQKVNAEYMQMHGAAVLMLDEELPERIVSLVKDLMNDEGKLAAMRQAMQGLATPHAAEAIIQAMENLIPRRQGRTW
jgi:UDP-N-acetylglucosamine--N-acetylmuramyl-(pentapeptide) pyrophosphoryl-undecaprenol N-acetylglucosamine transferase